MSHRKMEEYHPAKAIEQTFIPTPGEPTLVVSGGLTCKKCGREIPPKELICVRCYWVNKPEPTPKPRRIHPDDPGNMFEGL